MPPGAITNSNGACASRTDQNDLRKAALTRLADAGCTAHEIAAISGHKTLSEVQRYTGAANRARLAKAAMGRIANESVKPVPGKVSNPLNRLEKKLG